MHELANEGSVAVQRVEFAQLLSMMRARAEQVHATGALYRQGRIPLHLVAHALKAPLVSFLPGTGMRNRVSPDPRVQSPMLLRHGCRAFQNGAGTRSEACRLHLDITALLVAHDLGILDAVERCFKPLQISPCMVVALLDYLDKLAPQQPSHC